MENNRNSIIAIALTVLVVLAWQFLFMGPRLEEQRKAEELAQQQEAAQQQTTSNSGSASNTGTTTGTAVGGSSDAVLSQSGTQTETAPRVKIDTPSLAGSINLAGARIDDVKLKNYHVTVDKSSPIVTLFAPANTENGYFAELGFVQGSNSGKVPGPQTVWTLENGDQLTPSTPVEISYTNDSGLTFHRTFSIDDEYMITVDDKVTNNSSNDVTVSPYGRLTRFNKPEGPSAWVLHEGFLGVMGPDDGVTEDNYKSIEKEDLTYNGASGGWFGLTDKYWGGAIVPQSSINYDVRFSHFTDGRSRYQADYSDNDPLTVAAGQTAELKTMVFAGAKETNVLTDYQKQYNIPLFDRMIDWGWLWFITKPLFQLMDFIYHMVGNFGVAILITTVIIKLLFFPLASKQYASMANMKRVQPQMAALKEQYGDDRMGLQKAMMELYKKEKINPVAGCWPVLIQIPIFFALYKVLYVTIEMRHAPFFGWIQDLSAPDPTSVFNLFGLLPFAVPAVLMIGAWPIIMGITMWMQMRMNPTPPDKTQAMIFNWMPVVFTFMLAKFPAGLVIYYAWNNSLSILQQSIIMKRHGVKIELFDNLKGLFRRKKATSE
ncbi:membrane protein insertase YidC [Martelella mediterranea]|uniref:Membrane protein insertase YidC n=1 Tax=Martelella mediterranea TaxID=293089 RepID=A0A4R3NVX4_9HYPH|nr:membrane protein insertase YidC [Martelella mediterranea]TCT43075.1 protein translocase subunit yidC [Martelella mediterranea]